MSAVIAADKIDGGGFERYETMDAMRKEVTQHGGSLQSFPYARDFSSWEENGIIGAEMTRNLLICGFVILVVIFVMIPDPQIAGWAILCILLSIFEVTGMLWYWDVTVNSITTIYVLISAGLAVDYCAHIAHMFKESKGTAEQRAAESLGRIGPCVLNAIISTFLAVSILGFSKSYIFRTMFQCFFLVVTIAGSHGLWLLPVLLTLAGGDNGEASDPPAVSAGKDDNEMANPVADEEAGEVAEVAED
jgi:Niemann-Pick C1 protein